MKKPLLTTTPPTDLRAALAKSPKAKAVWDDTTPLAKRDWIFWITSGKRDATRGIRITTAISKLSGGMRRPCCFPGINWVPNKVTVPKKVVAE